MKIIHYKDYKIGGNILCIIGVIMIFYDEPYLEYIGIFLLFVGIFINKIIKINKKNNIKLTNINYIDHKINNNIDYDYHNKIINKFGKNNNIPKFNNNILKFDNNIYKFINNNYDYDNITLFLDIYTFIININNNIININNNLMDYYNHYNNIISYILSFDKSSNNCIPKLLDDLVDDYNANSKQLYIISKKIFDTYDFKDIKHNMIMKYLSSILLNILDKEIEKIDLNSN
jgi:hypothetical protein